MFFRSDHTETVKDLYCRYKRGESLSYIKGLALAVSQKDLNEALAICDRVLEEDGANFQPEHSLLFQFVVDGLLVKHKKKGKRELEVEKAMVANWDKLEMFSGFINPRRQVRTVLGEVIDILAVEEDSGRPVIIELKMGKKKAEKQLLSYARYFRDEHPILVSVNEEPVPDESRLDFIEYFSMSEVMAGILEI